MRGAIVKKLSVALIGIIVLFLLNELLSKYIVNEYTALLL
ncbi:hypothetical protein LYSBPC_21550 [Lysinibacillus piscis]|uniref:Uncharacterized protein n=1 Tax=Lysinibacillus piscis TaxID=2518931 RepID=A0ABQ5NLN0_9BACI|nr:hypothetical protein LYSBPC_21550 [Lysinibacillus sp. KH24]